MVAMRAYLKVAMLDKEGQRKWLENIYQWIIEKNILFYLVAFLLGRAVILNELIPFSLAYLVSVRLVKKENERKVIIFSLIGALTVNLTHLSIVLGSYLFFFLFNSFHFVAKSKKHLPCLIFFAHFRSEERRVGHCCC